MKDGPIDAAGVIIIKGDGLPVPMEVRFTKDAMEFKKVLNHVDEFAASFVKELGEHGVDYVIVSGYVALLFGRSRSTEDVDLIVSRMQKDDFARLYGRLQKRFWCINADSADDAFDCLSEGCAIRFADKGKAIPNMEFKFPKTTIDAWSLRHRKKVVMNDNTLFISPFEMHIAFKFKLGSEKDIEDAVYIYHVFKERIDPMLLKECASMLGVEKDVKRFL